MCEEPTQVMVARKQREEREKETEKRRRLRTYIPFQGMFP
jgi:hypothetical protein